MSSSSAQDYPDRDPRFSQRDQESGEHAIAPDAEPTPAEQELLSRLRAGDAKAFETLFHAHYNALCVFAESYVHSAHVAEELVEDVFCWIGARRTEWRVERGIKAYLYTAVRNRALKQVSHSRMAERVHDAADREDRLLAMGQPTPNPDARVAASELALAVQRAVASLPPRCRQAYLLHRQHELSYVEIAEIMGTSVKTVENQLARALKALRMSLAAWHP